MSPPTESQPLPAATAAPPLPGGLLRALLGFAGTAAVAGLILAWLTPANRAGFDWINQGASQAFGEPVLEFATILGDGLCATMLLALALPWVPRLTAAGLLAAPLASVLTHLPKALLAEARPVRALGLPAVHVHGIVLSGMNSFPSGHSITAFTVATVALCVMPGRPDGRARRLPLLAVPALAAVVAVSRIAVGAHWPDDVCAGAALGVVAGIAGDWASRRWTGWQRPIAQGWTALFLLACALVLWRYDTGYPAALAAQRVLAALGGAAALWHLSTGMRMRWAQRGVTRG